MLNADLGWQALLPTYISDTESPNKALLTRADPVRSSPLQSAPIRSTYSLTMKPCHRYLGLHDPEGVSQQELLEAIRLDIHSDICEPLLLSSLIFL
jgi:hypothetical protein